MKPSTDNRIIEDVNGKMSRLYLDFEFKLLNRLVARSVDLIVAVAHATRGPGVLPVARSTCSKIPAKIHRCIQCRSDPRRFSIFRQFQ